MFEAVNCPLIALGPPGNAQGRSPANIGATESLSANATVVAEPLVVSDPIASEVEAVTAQPTEPLTRKLRRKVPAAVLAFGVVSLLTDLSTEAVNAVLPLYLTAVLGLGPLAYGFIDGMYQGVSAAVRILGGWWSDKSRRPKWVSFTGYAASAVARIFLLFTTGVAAIAAIVTVDRLGKGLRTGPRDALLASASEPGELGRNFGIHRALDTIGASVGPLAAFAILAAIPWGAGGYRTVFIMSAAVALLGLVVLVSMVPDLRELPRKIKKVGRWADLRTPAMVKLYVVAGLLGLATIGDGFIYLTLAQNDALAAQYFPLLFVGTNVAFLALSIPLGKLADRIGRATVFIGGHAVLLLMYGLLFLGQQSLPWIIAVLTLSGIYYAATDGVLAALTAQVVGAEGRASGISATQTFQALARFGSSIGFGFIWQFWGSATAVLVIAGVLVVAVGVSTYLLRPFLRPQAV